MFHRVLPKILIEKKSAYVSIGTLISIEFFESILKLLILNDYEFVSISEIKNTAAQGKRIALTFDDGYSDNYDYVLESLHKHGAKATFFPVVHPCKHQDVLPLDIYYQCIDGLKLNAMERHEFITGSIKKAFYWESPENQLKMIETYFGAMPKNRRVAYLNPQQLKHMNRLGHEIGSHGMTHTLSLSASMTDQKVFQEMTESKRWLEDTIGVEILSYCFPAGCYNLKMIELAKNAGYQHTCLVKREAEGVEALPSYERIFVKPDSMPTLMNQLTQI